MIFVSLGLTTRFSRWVCFAERLVFYWTCDFACHDQLGLGFQTVRGGRIATDVPSCPATPLNPPFGRGETIVRNSAWGLVKRCLLCSRIRSCLL